MRRPQSTRAFLFLSFYFSYFRFFLLFQSFWFENEIFLIFCSSQVLLLRLHLSFSSCPASPPRQFLFFLFISRLQLSTLSFQVFPSQYGPNSDAITTQLRQWSFLVTTDYSFRPLFFLLEAFSQQRHCLFSFFFLLLNHRCLILPAAQIFVTALEKKEKCSEGARGRIAV